MASNPCTNSDTSTLCIVGLFGSGAGGFFALALFAADMRGFDALEGVSAKDECCVLEEVFGLS